PTQIAAMDGHGQDALLLHELAHLKIHSRIVGTLETLSIRHSGTATRLHSPLGRALLTLRPVAGFGPSPSGSTPALRDNAHFSAIFLIEDLAVAGVERRNQASTVISETMTNVNIAAV